MIDPKVEAALRRLWDRTHDDEAHELLATIRAALINRTTSTAHCRIPTDAEPSAIPPFPNLTDRENTALGVIVKAAHDALSALPQTPNPQTGEGK